MYLFDLKGFTQQLKRNVELRQQRMISEHGRIDEIKRLPAKGIFATDLCILKSINI